MARNLQQKAIYIKPNKEIKIFINKINKTNNSFYYLHYILLSLMVEQHSSKVLVLVRIRKRISILDYVLLLMNYN
jgi:hypothetical protein